MEALKRLSSIAISAPKVASPPNARHAAVLAILYPAQVPGGLNVLLTLRSSSLRSHAGDVSLPGGRHDEGESDWDAARREAMEEINFPLDFPGLEQVATFPPYLSKNNMLVTPCIAYVSSLDGYSPIANPGEVDEIFDVPLSTFLSKERYSGKWIQWYGLNWKMHVCFFFFILQRVVARTNRPEIFHVEGRRIWGLTARILVDIARIALASEPEFECNSECKVLYVGIPYSWHSGRWRTDTKGH